jgi:hypothetical protein
MIFRKKMKSVFFEEQFFFLENKTETEKTFCSIMSLNRGASFGQKKEKKKREKKKKEEKKRGEKKKRKIKSRARFLILFAWIIESLSAGTDWISSSLSPPEIPDHTSEDVGSVEDPNTEEDTSGDTKSNGRNRSVTTERATAEVEHIPEDISNNVWNPAEQEERRNSKVGLFRDHKTIPNEFIREHTESKSGHEQEECPFHLTISQPNEPKSDETSGIEKGMDNSHVGSKVVWTSPKGSSFLHSRASVAIFLGKVTEWPSPDIHNSSESEEEGSGNGIVLGIGNDGKSIGLIEAQSESNEKKKSVGEFHFFFFLRLDLFTPKQ